MKKCGGGRGVGARTWHGLCRQRITITITTAAAKIKENFSNADGDGNIMNSRCFENRRRKSYSFSQFATLEKRRKVALVNFRQHFWNCYLGQGKNWPMADRRVSTVTIPEAIAERISVPGLFSFSNWRLVGHVSGT